MDNPFLVEVTRGNLVESRHRGSVSVIDADGSTVLSLGDVERHVFPRSAVKALQALPLIESGIADKYGRGGLHAGEGRAGCFLPRMRRSLADGRSCHPLSGG
jgi:L-asparaginase II